jgi:hypothetical protein
MTVRAVWCLFAALAACGGREQPADGAAGVAFGAAAAPESTDPCSLLTRAEAEEVLGPLVNDPHRDSTGKGCAYRTAGDRLLVLTPEWTYGKSELDMSRMIGGLVSRVADIHGAAADTLEGPWDEAGFGPTEIIFRVKARALTVAYAQSATDLAGAVTLARHALVRLAAVPEPERPKVADGVCPLPEETVSEIFGQEVRTDPNAGRRTDACDYTLAIDPTAAVELAIHPEVVGETVFDGLVQRAKSNTGAEPNRIQVGEGGLSWGGTGTGEAAVRANGQVYHAQVHLGMGSRSPSQEEAMVKLVERMIQKP